jgi:CDP-glucose 4,6-dehydratase
MFNNVYLNKKILITGASGFKGSWLSLWLISLGAHVFGYSWNLTQSFNVQRIK